MDFDVIAQGLQFPEGPIAMADLPNISTDAILNDIKKLSSDEFEGRKPGTKGEQLTVQYLIDRIAQRLAGVIWQVLQFIWNWSFGQVVKMFQMPFNNLPLWKQVLFVVVVAALAYFLYKLAKDLLKAVQSVLRAIVGLISALIAMLPQIVYAGLVAFGGAWVITNLSPTWIPIALR